MSGLIIYLLKSRPVKQMPNVALIYVEPWDISHDERVIGLQVMLVWKASSHFFYLSLGYLSATVSELTTLWWMDEFLLSTHADR